MDLVGHPQTNFDKHPTFLPVFLLLLSCTSPTLFQLPELILIVSTLLLPSNFVPYSHVNRNYQQHQRTLLCSFAAPTTLICPILPVLASRSCTSSMFPCSTASLYLAFHQRRCVLCESPEIENVLANQILNNLNHHV